MSFIRITGLIVLAALAAATATAHAQDGKETTTPAQPPPAQPPPAQPPPAQPSPLAAAGVPIHDGGLDWPLGLRILPGAQARRARVELLFYFAATQAGRGQVNPRLQAEIQGALTELARHLLADHAERLTLTPAMYRQSAMFLTQLHGAVDAISALEMPAGSNPYHPSAGPNTGAPARGALAVAGAQSKGVIGTPPTYYGGMMRSPWFDQPGIRKQIGFTDQQFQRFNKAYGQAWTRFSKDIEGLGKPGTAKYSAGFNKLTQTFNQSFSKATQDVLKPEQAKRYDELFLQYRGLGAFADPRVYEKLKLSDGQRATLGKAADSYHQSMLGLYKDSNNRQEATQRFEQLRRESGKTINETLTPQQQQAWRNMIGEPYTFAPPWTMTQPKGSGQQRSK
jgi:hypothetical protein